MGSNIEKDGEYFITLSPDEIVKQWVCLFYGGSGTQKTRTAAQWPNPMFLSCERGQYGGLLSAREFSPKQVVIKSWDEYLAVLPKLQAGAGVDFNTLVLDSATAMQQFIMRDILSAAYREIPQYEDWNLNANRMRTLINTLSNLNCHLIMIATEQITQDGYSKEIKGLPNLPGKLAAELPPATDLCLHFSARSQFTADGKQETIFLMHSVPTSMWAGKDCSGFLPAEMATKTGESTFKHLEKLFT